MENHWAKIIWILNYINMKESHFRKDCDFFNSVFMTGEIPDEQKNSTAIPTERKPVNKVWKIIAYLKWFIKYTKVFNKKLKAQAKQFLLVCQNGLWKGRCCNDASFTTKVLTEKGRYNIETHLACLDCVKAFDTVKIDKSF